MGVKNCQLFGNKFRQVRQEGLLRVQRNNCGLFFSKSYTFFHHFRNMSEELSTFRRKIFGRLVKIAIWVSRGSFWEITTFLKRVYVLFHHFWTSKYFFKNFVEKTSSWLSKLHFTCPLEGSEQIIFLKNFILIRFRNSSNKFATSGKKLQRGRHNGFLGIQMKVMGKRFIGKKFFMFFLPWPENISTFWQKLFIKVVKKAFYVSWGTCWGVFLGKEIMYLLTTSRFLAKIFGILTESFQQAYQNWV